MITSPCNGHCGEPCLGQEPTDDCGEGLPMRDVDNGDRVRGGVATDDPTDAAEFFQQYGLPNLLSDDEADADEVDAAAGSEGAVGWPVHHHQLLRPLYPGPGRHCNVQQFAYALFRIKTGSIRDDRADQLCKMIAEIMHA